MDTTDILLVVLIVMGLALGVLVTINIRSGIKQETRMGQTATDATLEGRLAVLVERISTLESDKMELTALVHILQQKVAELETQKITKLEDLNKILKDHIDTLNAKIAGLEESFAVLKKGLGIEGNVTVVPKESIIVEPKAKAPRAKATPKEQTP